MRLTSDSYLQSLYSLAIILLLSTEKEATFSTNRNRLITENVKIPHGFPKVVGMLRQRLFANSDLFF
jgi:hypothetical protein